MSRSLRSIARCTILSLSVLTGIAACTVKEDRSVCPCLLEVRFPDKGQIKGPVLLTGWSAERVFEDMVDAVECQDTHTRKVPKSTISFGAIDGISTCVYSGHSVIIPQDKECDSLYAYIDTVDCTGDRAVTEVVFHKQFATVNLRFPGRTVTAEDYSFVVESNSSGMDVLTCKPVEGVFRFEPEIRYDGALRFRLPRQIDGSLSLTVRHIPSGASARFPLGYYIGYIGYDWEAEDLHDIYITLDLVREKADIGVAGWEEYGDYELTTVEL